MAIFFNVKTGKKIIFSTYSHPGINTNKTEPKEIQDIKKRNLEIYRKRAKSGLPLFPEKDDRKKKEEPER